MIGNKYKHEGAAGGKTTFRIAEFGRRRLHRFTPCRNSIGIPLEQSYDAKQHEMQPVTSEILPFAGRIT
jgi:hypothetical protein